jgi:hypothetical protein
MRQQVTPTRQVRVRNQQNQKQSAQSTVDQMVLGETNPLSEELLSEALTELAAITGAPSNQRAQTVCLDLPEFQDAVEKMLPRRLLDKGLGAHFRAITDPSYKHRIFVGPSALAGLNEGQGTVITDLMYQLIAATGCDLPLLFERGSADLIAAQLAENLGINIYTDHYPAERLLVSQLIEAIRERDEQPIELVGLMRRSPKQFFERLHSSGFWQWWNDSIIADPAYSDLYGRLLERLTRKSLRLDPTFLGWATSCATAWVEYRRQQSRNALSGAAKRAAQKEDEEVGTLTAQQDED